MQLLYMQYMPGGTLSDVVQRVKRTPASDRSSQILLDVLRDRLSQQGEGADLTLPSAIRNASWWMTVAWLGMHLAGALDHAHAKGVLHRDLKPANVLLGRDGNPRLADFNVSASTVVASHVSAAYFGGSLAYMSPEQLEAFSSPPDMRESMMDGRSDVFSLGILLWEVLMGWRPFRDEQITDLEVDTLVQLATKRRSGPTAEDWKAIAAVAPSGLVMFFRTCLAPDPGSRFDNAAAARRSLMLCGNEASRKLLQPQAESWTGFFRRYPLIPLVIAGIVPNAISSALNIFFNLNIIIGHLKLQAQESLKLTPEAARRLVLDAFELSMLAINPIAYGIGIVLCVSFAAPVVLAAAKANRGISVAPEIRYRALRLPVVVAFVTAMLWVLSGPAFPIVLSYRGVHLNRADFIHFSASQAICGLLAASLAFLFTAPIVLRIILPPLLDSKQDDPRLFTGLQRLSTQALHVVFVCFAVTVLSAALWASAENDAKGTFIAFLICGFALAAVNFLFVKPKIIDPDIAALQATTMIDEDHGGDTQSSIAGTRSRRSHNA